MITPDAPLILIAEDDALLSLTVEDTLADAGFAHVAVSSGDAAISELEQDVTRFAAVLTDIRMPGASDGWQVGRRARELSANIPVVYMTGDGAHLWSAHGVPNSILLQKPFLPVQLLTALATLLNKGDSGSVA